MLIQTKDKTIIGLILILILNISDTLMTARRNMIEATAKNKGRRNKNLENGFLFNLVLCLIFYLLRFLQEKHHQQKK